jgi:hypothetical protein
MIFSTITWVVFIALGGGMLYVTMNIVTEAELNAQCANYFGSIDDSLDEIMGKYCATDGCPCTE